MQESSYFLYDRKMVAGALLFSVIKNLLPNLLMGDSGSGSSGFYVDCYGDFPEDASVLREIEDRLERITAFENSIAFREMTPENAREYFLFRKEPHWVRIAEDRPHSLFPVLDWGGALFPVAKVGAVTSTKEVGFVRIYRKESIPSRPAKTRIYGEVFASKEEKKRFTETESSTTGCSHLAVGQRKKYCFSSDRGITWLPNGLAVISSISRKICELLEKEGFSEISTRPVANALQIKEYVAGWNEAFEVMGSRSDVYERVTVSEERDPIPGEGAILSPVHSSCLAFHPVRTEDLCKEIISLLIFVTKIFKILDFPFRVVWIGRERSREEKLLVKAMEDSRISFTREEGDGTGARVEWKSDDGFGTSWPVARLYPPVRNIRGFDGIPLIPILSFERIAALIWEKTSTEAAPFWLAPLQVLILPEGPEHLQYAKEIFEVLYEKGIRVRIVPPEGRLRERVRSGFAEGIPFVVSVGDSDVKNDTVTERKSGKDPVSFPRTNWIMSVNRNMETGESF